MAISTSKNDKAVDRIRIIVKMADFNRQDRISTIRRYLIVLYLANIHPSFKDAGERDDNLRYFSGPKLKDVARRISKEWRMGNNRIKFDRSRIALTKYEKCEDDGYVKIRKLEHGKNRIYALTREGFKHCEEIINSSYWTASSKNVSKVRIIDFDNYSKKTYFLALKEDGSYVLGTADYDLRRQGVTENSLVDT